MNKELEAPSVEGSIGLPNRITLSLIRMTMTKEEYVKWTTQQTRRIKSAQWRVRKKINQAK